MHCVRTVQELRSINKCDVSAKVRCKVFMWRDCVVVWCRKVTLWLPWGNVGSNPEEAWARDFGPPDFAGLLLLEGAYIHANGGRDAQQLHRARGMRD